MKLIDLLGLTVPIGFFVFWGIELWANRSGHGRQLQTVRGWGWVGVFFLLFGSAVSLLAPLWLPVEWLDKHRLFNLSGLGLWGAPVTFVVASFISYWFHRSEHRFDVLWRGLHQTHHSGERVDMPGWALSHPFEFFFFTGIAVITGVFILGVDPLAAAIAGSVNGVLSQFQHVNIPTPRWIGYIVQRPEQHCLHHERDVHARNYTGDLVIWDMLFGSYYNPPAFSGQVGFGRSAIRALPRMLVFADVNGERSPQQ
jgi:sterol desaturase/sphingolipid hydroxylase (fatty acid hydroxylase superfamily)